jgi:tetratricopeptide (TPR) repeat protein
VARAKAEEHLLAAEELAKKRGTPDSFLYAADALHQAYSGQLAKAKEELGRQVSVLREERRESATLNLTLGIIQMNAGDTEAARDSLTRAQELAQSDARVYAALGNFYRRQGQERLALDNFDAALRFERSHPESMLGSSLTLLERERPNLISYKAAALKLKELLNMEPPPSPRQLAVAHLARALLMGRVQKELSGYDADGQRLLLEATGVPSDPRLAQAEVVREEDKGFSLDPHNPELQLLKGKRLALEGQLDAATQAMRAGIEQDRNRAQLYVELARLLMQRPSGEKEAIAALTQALRSMGDSPKLLVLLGQAYRKQNSLSEALNQFQRAVADPKVKNPEARLAMGSIYREQKDWPRAIDTLEKAAKEYVGQRTKVAEVYTELGRVYEEKGDRANADQEYQRALKSDPEYSASYFYYGRFLAGDRAVVSKAREFFKQYLTLEPKGEFADEANRRVAQL